jgi:hypothetical protein
MGRGADEHPTSSMSPSLTSRKGNDNGQRRAVHARELLDEHLRERRALAFGFHPDP